jgi:hypothetical protein
MKAALLYLLAGWLGALFALLATYNWIGGRP